ncbi:hypothetical protein Agabi119p4_2495 [Agaricus bisporus var. burnettii]|uniref:Retrotransposon Copia-like N-terminal domain-containing protein n=1 Tax=Agaricus bisporus var. burnettii TaxID=192524 RepID=A0A8H7KK11_AGABI|nr:hypothetical protein Agabi119p4_2495 [Agaricus bisporus var. burnettii]
MSHVMALLPSVAMLTGAENYTTWRNAMSDILTLLPADGFPFSGLDVCENKWQILMRNISSTAADGSTIVLTQEQVEENEVIDNARKERECLSRTAIAMINARTTNSLIPIRNFHISGAKEPSAEIAQLEQIYSQLISNNVEIPPLVQAMKLLRSIPEQWKIASSFLAAKGDVKDVTFHAVRSAILQEYNQHQTANNSQAHQFSGVKQGNQKPALRLYKRQQQQQQRPYNNGSHQNQLQMCPQGQQQQRSGLPPKKNCCGKKTTSRTRPCLPLQVSFEMSLLNIPYEHLTLGRFKTAKLR